MGEEFKPLDFFWIGPRVILQDRISSLGYYTGQADFLLLCHSVLDTESGVWIPAPDQVEGMLSRE